METNDKYIQIITAPNDLYAVFQMEDGTEEYSRIPLFALTEKGDIEMIDIDDSGWFDNPVTTRNFLRIEYK